MFRLSLSDHNFSSFKTAFSQKTSSLKGIFTLPGDKSISHRALILGGLAKNKTEISGLLESDDVLNTMKAMQKLGANIEKLSEKWIIYGVGNGCLLEPEEPLDFGNSGTGVRLIMGLLGSYHFKTTFVGDESLSKRPMDRILKPLELMGTQIIRQEGNGLPLTIKGSKNANPIEYTSPIASAQVKSAVLLAALNTAGITTFIEKEPSRNHTEIMLQNFGVSLDISKKGKETIVQIKGQQELIGQSIQVPGDPSSAAFLIVAALIVPNSDILLQNILINETRIGLIEILLKMGADISFCNQKTVCGEKIADIRVRTSKLKAIDIPEDIAPFMIDEYPILSIACAYASGTTKMNGLKELRVKESDRLKNIALGLKQNQILCEEGSDFLSITGQNAPYQGGVTIDSCHDHRIAMSFLVLGLTTIEPISVTNSHMIRTSFPNFIELMTQSGAKIGWKS